jgi:methionine biosynthesis protein MetW
MRSLGVSYWFFESENKERQYMNRQTTYSELQKSLYDQMVPIDKNDIIRFNKLRRIISDLVGIGGKKILELGCNDGSLLKEFCESNLCYGVDISGECLQKAASRGYRTYRTDLEKANLPFKDSYFDIVVCSEVLEHIVNTEDLMNEINRVSNKNAHLLLSFPNSNQPISLICLLMDITPAYSARIYSPHVRDISLKLLTHLLKAKGYTVLKEHGTYIYPFTSKVSTFLANAFPRLGEKIIVVAKKERDPIHLPNVFWNVKDLLFLNKKFKKTNHLRDRF